MNTLADQNNHLTVSKIPGACDVEHRGQNNLHTCISISNYLHMTQECALAS